MRNTHSKKLISSLLAATLAGFFAISIMPEVRCSADACQRSSGGICIDAGKVLIGWKPIIGIDG